MIFLTVAMGGCRSKKVAESSAYESGAPSATHTTAKKSKSATAERTLSTDYANMTGQYAAWSGMSVPVKVAVKKPKNISLSGTLSMVYGTAVSVQLKMLFFDAATLYADADSIIVVSKPMGVYYAESMRKFTDALGLDIRDMQALLLGQAFVPGKGTATAAQAKDFKFTKGADVIESQIYAWILTPTKKIKGLDWHFNALAAYDPTVTVPQIYGLDISLGDNDISCSYATSQATPAGITAAQMQLQGTVKKHSIDLTLSQTGTPVWNGNVRIARPTIPRGAGRLTTAQIFSLLGSL